VPLYSLVCTTCHAKVCRVSTPTKEFPPCKVCGGSLESEIPVESLVETPGNMGRKLARQFGQKNKQLTHKHNIRTT